MGGFKHLDMKETYKVTESSVWLHSLINKAKHLFGMYSLEKKGQFGGGAVTIVLIFMVIAIFLSFTATTLDDISQETAGNTSDVAFNTTQNAEDSIDTFSSFLTPLSYLGVGVVFLLLIGKIGTKLK